MDSFFDIHDAKGYVLLKDSKKKAIVGDEIIDLRPYLIQEEQRLAKHQQLRTPESETATPTVKPPKKRKAIPLKSTEIIVRPTPPKKSAVARKEPKRARLVSTTPEPQMSEYEKMQLLIANAASEATTSSPRTKRVRRMSTAEPLPKPTQQPASPVIQNSRPNLPPRRRKISSVDITVAVEESATSPKSPKVAVYDEWQELLKNARKEAETSTGRSRRVRRPRPEEDETPPSPRKRHRKEELKPNHPTSSSADEKPHFQSTSMDELGDEVPDNRSSIVVNSIRNDTKHEMAGIAGRTGTGCKETDFGIKIRRNIRALGGDEISKVKSEMAMVQPYLNNTQTTGEPPYISEKPTSDTKPRERSTADERPVFARRKSQPYKFAEAELLEENRLFMFAILATEGVMGNQRTM